MPQQSHRDHGVTGPTHWLLDEELALRSKGRTVVPTPALLLHKEIPPVPVAAGQTAELPPRRHFVFLLAAMVAAVLVYALLRSADVGGALEEVFAGEDSGTVRVVANIEEPGARELAELRSLLAFTSTATVERPAAASSFERPKKAKGPKAPGPDDGVLPPLPPPPAPPPLIPELKLPPEIPALEIALLRELEVPELPVTSDLLELP
jgi:hypothetical protein